MDWQVGADDILLCPYSGESHCLSVHLLNLCLACLELITKGKPTMNCVLMDSGCEEMWKTVCAECERLE